jgi:organic radical activating enzyme
MKFSQFFYTIQGEGNDVGKPVFLIRLVGCNLKCKMCDTKFSSYEIREKLFDAKDVLDYLRDNQIISVRELLITGGEPTLHFTKSNNTFFTTLVNHFGFRRIQIETNGINGSPEYFTYAAPYLYFGGADVKLNVSPKLSEDAHGVSTFDDVLIRYEKFIPEILCYAYHTNLQKVFFKFVYDGKPETEKKIEKFVLKFRIPEEIVSIMPYTPVNEYEEHGDIKRFFEEFKEYRLKAVSYALRSGFRYCPREHIELYFINEDEHVKKLASRGLEND